MNKTYQNIIIFVLLILTQASATMKFYFNGPSQPRLASVKYLSDPEFMCKPVFYKSSYILNYIPEREILHARYVSAEVLIYKNILDSAKAVHKVVCKSSKPSSSCKTVNDKMGNAFMKIMTAKSYLNNYCLYGNNKYDKAAAEKKVYKHFPGFDEEIAKYKRGEQYSKIYSRKKCKIEQDKKVNYCKDNLNKLWDSKGCLSKAYKHDYFCREEYDKKYARDINHYNEWKKMIN